MDKFKNGVPFDPGYSRYAYSFIGSIGYITREYSQLKIPNQKKFKLGLIEPKIVDLIEKCTALHLGYILWGSFVYHRFKDDPRKIIDNNTKGLLENTEVVDCAQEAKIMLEYIEKFDRDCKYFLKKPAKINPLTVEILKNYCEFAKLNDNFLDVSCTSNVKLPEAVDHFKSLSNEQLDNLYDQIIKIIESGKIEDLLNIGFYKV